MRLAVPSPPLRRELIAWFGVLGAPLAWTAQHVTGFALTEAACHEAATRWDVALQGWTIAVSAAALAITIAAGVAAVTTFRLTRDVDENAEGPPGRQRFMGTAGLALVPLFLAMIVMTGLGVSLLDPRCPR